MPKPTILWDPAGIELDALGSKSYLRSTDGDTPYVSVSTRMLSVDTPDVHCSGRSKPSRSDEKLAELASWIEQRESLSTEDRNRCDMESRELYSPQQYHLVPPYSRVFVWKKDLSEAVSMLNLKPGDA